MKNKGFSLVELIVVIAIMAILVGVAVPVYSSYIEKANAAKDEQLLGEINSAFAVVCAGNAIDINTVTEADIPVENGVVNLSGMTVKVNGAAKEGFGTAMVGILGEDLEFAVIEDIWYDTSAHKFVDNSAAGYEYGGGMVYLKPSDIAALNASGFITSDGLGVSALLNKVDYVAGFATGLDSTIYRNVLSSPGFMENFLASLGVSTEGKTREEIQALYGEQMTILAKQKAALTCSKEAGAAECSVCKNSGVTCIYSSGSDVCTSCQNAAMNALLANATVLYAAQNTTQKNIISVLQSGDAKGQLVNAMNGANSGEGLAQVSAAYGLYVSYAHSLPAGSERDEAIRATEDPILIINKLEDPGFQAYLATEQAKADLEGYMAAMNMMNDSTKNNGEAVSNVLVNGFADEDLINIFEDALGK